MNLRFALSLLFCFDYQFTWSKSVTIEDIFYDVIPESPSVYGDGLDWKDYDNDYDTLVAIADAESGTIDDSYQSKFILFIFVITFILLIWCCYCPCICLLIGDQMRCFDIRSQARKFLSLPPPGNYIDEKGVLIKYKPTAEEQFYYEKCKKELLGI